MSRHFSAIEIAEGALLADLAVLAQLVAVYLPPFDLAARLLIALIFAVLVLRRGLRVALLGAAVAGFIVSTLTGLTFALPLALTCGAGLFLGAAMRWRLPHLALIVLGMTGGGATVLALLVLLTLAAGLPLSSFARELANAYQGVAALAGWLAGLLGLGAWWREAARPPLDALAGWALQYWWAMFPLALWLSLAPVVVLMYTTTNMAARLLGYDVRPFPGARAERAMAWLARLPLRLRRRRAP
ncbi:DUF2232 domain-containing protein [Kouleothrix sp.]|uniref:DUF2232 domain-containing protein n=1 Tax=Kouleothrix sp. TaxID=2779161 RepID=UPI00391B7403